MRCPECGWTATKEPGWLLGLDRAPMRAIVGVAIRQAMVVTGDILFAGLLLLTVVRSEGGYLIAAGVGLIGLGLGGWFRVSPTQWPPEDRRRSLPRIVRLVVGVAIVGLVFGLVARVVFGSWPSSRTLIPLELWVGCVLAGGLAVFSGPTAAWSRDDRAERLLGSSPWVMILAVVAGVLAVALAGPFGMNRRFQSMLGLMLLVWWLLVLFADGSLLLSATRCLLHRQDHDQMDLRRRDRETDWQEDVVGRLDPAEDRD